MNTQPKKTKQPMRVPLGALIFLNIFILIKAIVFYINPEHYSALFGGIVLPIIYMICLLALLLLLCLRSRNKIMVAVLGSLCACEAYSAISYTMAMRGGVEFGIVLQSIISASLFVCYAALMLILIGEISDNALWFNAFEKPLNTVFTVSLVVYALANLLEIVYHGNQLEAFLFIGAILLIRIWISDPWAVYAEHYVPLSRLFFLWNFTYGIYPYIWVYNVTKYSNLSGERKRSPAKTLLLFIFVPFYSLYWFYKMGSAIDTVAGDKKLKSDITLLCFLLYLFGLGIIAILIMQDKINQTILRSENDIEKLKQLEREFILGENAG